LNVILKYGKMPNVKRFFKRNSHNNLFKGLAGLGRAINRFYENRNHDFYSNGEFTVLQKISKFNPSVIIDGGANIGEYSLLINDLSPSSQIYSFEPVKSTFEKLKKMLPVQKILFLLRKVYIKRTVIVK
jgi:hypothetical protein